MSILFGIVSKNNLIFKEMEILKNPWFWAAIAALILMIWLSTQKTPVPAEPSYFSVNDIGYGFMVNLIDEANGKFSVEYMPNLQGGAASYRRNTCWYKTDGIPEEVLTPGTMFIPLKDGRGLKFQKVVVASSTMNDLGGVERTYDRLDEYYNLPAEYLQKDAGYVPDFGDWLGQNF